MGINENDILRITHTEDIERSILCSVLENIHLGADIRIANFCLNETYFNNDFHKLIVRGVNRLKELDEPVNTNFLRERFFSSKAWSVQKDNMLIEIISANPIGTFKLFTDYYNVLKKQDKYKLMEI